MVKGMIYILRVVIVESKVISLSVPLKQIVRLKASP
jgi:hypothetical protein